jgi:hypothetical protein
MNGRRPSSQRFGDKANTAYVWESESRASASTRPRPVSLNVEVNVEHDMRSDSDGNLTLNVSSLYFEYDVLNIYVSTGNGKGPILHCK